MNNEAYTAYPHEGEIVLMDGATVNVWSIDYNVLIVNNHESMSEFNNRKASFIHMLHAK